MQVQSVQRLDFAIGIGTGMIGTSPVLISALTWTNQAGTALTWAAPVGCPIYQVQNYLSGQLQPMSAWRVFNSGTTNITIGYNGTTVPQTVLAPGEYAQGSEGRSLIQALEFSSNLAGGAITVTLFSS